MNKICESQQLPCSLQKFQSQIEGLEWLTSNDVGRWCAEQNKDLVSHKCYHFEVVGFFFWNNKFKGNEIL